ncbi:MAG: electron transport complex subunit RsxC, partial [Pseudomonadales bacterium]|nr:electron transport complex subunit RsxC [Pseudomonadales bacterium]
CEPYITSDHALMRERAEEIAQGIGILARLLKPREILLGIEDNKADVVENLQRELRAHDFSALCGRECSAEVITFPTKYPSGGEKQLIEILTGKQVPAGGLPAKLGIVCQNLGTAVAIADAVLRDKPLISRITTVTGEAVTTPCNFEVLLGTPVEDLLQACGYNAAQNNRLVMGGPMMGFALLDTRVPIVKTTNCLLAPTEAELPTPPPAQPCIRCGFCAEACPASLLPQQLYWFAQGKELEKLEEHNIADCIECGACSYVCPSNIPLVQYYRAAKAEIRERDRDMQQAEYAKKRFDARQERLQRLEEEKLAARKARQAKAAARSAQHARQNANEISGESGDADPKATAVAAAIARVEAKKAASGSAAASSGNAV